MTKPRLDIAANRAALALFAVLCALAGADSANAATTTLHLFAKTTRNSFTTPSGQAILGHNPPPPTGSVLTNVAVESAGTARHHAAAASAASNVVCFVTTAPMAQCDAQIAVGGAMLLASHFAANLAASNPFASIPIDAGTGRFDGAHGTIRTAPAGGRGAIEFTVTYATG